MCRERWLALSSPLWNLIPSLCWSETGDKTLEMRANPANQRQPCPQGAFRINALWGQGCNQRGKIWQLITYHSHSLSLFSQSRHQPKRLVLDPSSKLPLYKRTGVKAPSPAKQSQGGPVSQARSQDSAASGGQYCIYQKPKQVTCNVAHMKRVTNKYKYYCGTQSQDKICTGYR